MLERLRRRVQPALDPAPPDRVIRQYLEDGHTVWAISQQLSMTETEVRLAIARTIMREDRSGPIWPIHR